MKDPRWKSIFWKLLWTMGLIILAIISLYIVNHFKQLADNTFNLIPLLWTNLFVSIIFGVYVALILVKRWSLKLNLALLWCITIPCILVSFCYPILATVSSIYDNLQFSFIPYWLIRISTIEVFGIIAGKSLMLGIFNAQPTGDDSVKNL
ncbi:hypothetical protein [Bacillus sp. AK128]